MVQKRMVVFVLLGMRRTRSRPTDQSAANEGHEPFDDAIFAQLREHLELEISQAGNLLFLLDMFGCDAALKGNRRGPV